MIEQLLFVKSPHWKSFQEYLQEIRDQDLNRLIYSNTEQERIMSQAKVQVYDKLLKLREQVF